MASDHKPIYGIFNLNIKKFIEKKKMSVSQEVIKVLGSVNDQDTPRVEVVYLKLDFDK